MTQDLFVSTRKGLFRFQRSGGKWQQTYVAFLGQPVTAFLADPRTGHWYAALNLGHFGAKLHRSTNQGATWDELTMPTLPKSEDKDAPSLNQIWALEAGGADQPGLIWAGSLPAALFRNDRNGEGDWQLVEGLWNLPDRAKWFGGGTDDTALHSLCIDPRNSSRLVIAISCGGVWRSEDAGASWTCRSKGLFAEYMPPDRREDPDDPGPAPHRAVPGQARSLLVPAPQRHLLQHQRSRELAVRRPALRLRRRGASEGAREGLVRARDQGRAAACRRTATSSRPAPATAASRSRRCRTACRPASATTSSCATPSTSMRPATRWRSAPPPATST